MLACPRYVVAGNLTYLRSLVRELNSIESIDIYLLVNIKQLPDLDSLIENEKLLSFSAPSFMEGFAVQKLISKYDIDVVHFTNTLLPIGFKSRAKTVCTIHDLNFLTFSQGIVKDWYKKILYKYSIKSDGIIFISKFTKRTYLNYVGEYTGKNKIVYEASNYSMGASSTSRKEQKSLNLLCFGHRAHKNSEAAIKILALLDERFVLNIIGCHSKKTLTKLILDFGLEKQVAIHEDISDIELKSFYLNSFAFIFLSKYEGFGLPLLEAMSAGCPVITHDNCSIPEVAENAAYYVTDDISGYEKAAEFILKLNNDERLNQDYKKKSLDQFRKFSWTKNALETANFYNEVMG